MPLSSEKSQIACVFEQFWQRYDTLVKVTFVAVASC